MGSGCITSLPAPLRPCPLALRSLHHSCLQSPNRDKYQPNTDHEATMRTFTLLGSLLALVSVHVVKAADYGPCPYKENENCWEIMDNTGCFLNPMSTEQIFGCITGGKEGVRLTYLLTHFTTSNYLRSSIFLFMMIRRALTMMVMHLTRTADTDWLCRGVIVGLRVLRLPGVHACHGPDSEGGCLPVCTPFNTHDQREKRGLTDERCRGVNTDPPAPAPTSVERMRRILRA